MDINFEADYDYLRITSIDDSKLGALGSKLVNRQWSVDIEVGIKVDSYRYV